MKLSNVLAKIGEGEKTASVQAPAAPQGVTSEKVAASNTGDALRQALRDATAGGATEKQASTGSPVADLMKTAAAVADAEHDALLKEAQLYGAAVADSFVARLAQHNAALEQMNGGAKVASVQDGGFEKFASENPALVKEAAELGYTTTQQQMEKLAEAAYEKGYNETVEAIYKTAHASFVQGFQDISTILAEGR